MVSDTETVPAAKPLKPGPRAAYPAQGVLVVAATPIQPSETFIAAHVQALGGEDFFVYGNRHRFYHKGKPLYIGQSKAAARLNRLLCRWPAARKWFSGEAALRYFIKKRKIRAVLAEYGTTGTEVMEVCRQTRTPLLVHFHGYDASVTTILQQYGAAYKSMFQQAAAVFVVSKAMESRLLTLGCPQEKLIYNPYGPEPRFFELEPARTPGLFLAVGRFVEKKAPMLTLLAFYEVWKKEPSARMVMIGDGPLLGACQWLAKSLGIAEQVRFTGTLSVNDVIDYYRQAFCFVQHSVTAVNGDSEGTPVAILEAGAAGLPVVATRHAGIPDVVVESETGILVDEGDIESMADAMLRLYLDRTLTIKMGQAGRKRIPENFSLERHINILKEVINKVSHFS